MSSSPSDFPYSENTTCGLTCSPDVGPFSPMRGGAANNIYVIPVPDTLTFGTGTLLAAACCIHAILWLLSMLDKILEINWKSRFGLTDDELRINAPIEGTNGATIGKMRKVNETIRFFMGVAAVPVFTGAALGVLLVGEINFYSRPVRYQIEPMANAGMCALDGRSNPCNELTRWVCRTMVTDCRYHLGSRRLALSRFGRRYAEGQGGGGGGCPQRRRC